MRNSRFAVIALVMMAAGRAFGQGTSGYLPEPISVRQMGQYAERLNLSAAQRQAADEFHLQYQRDFQALRDGEVAEFLKIRVSGYYTRKFIATQNAIESKIVALDRALFDHLQTVLSDEQNVVMPRVRQTRQRERLMANESLWQYPYKPTDLSVILAELPHVPDEVRAADAMLIPYESALTAEMIQAERGADRTSQAVFDALAAAGIKEADFDDPNLQKRINEIIAGVWRDQDKSLHEVYLSMNRLHRRTAGAIIKVLPTELAGRFKREFCVSAYARAEWLRAVLDYLPLTQAAKRTDLKAEQLASIQRALADWQEKADKLIEESMDYIDEFEHRRATATLDQEYMTAFQEGCAAFDTRAMALRREAGVAQKSILGEVEAAKSIPVAERYNPVMDGAGWDLGGALPRPIGAFELTDYAMWMRLDDGQTNQMHAAHERYLSLFNDLKGREAASQKEAWSKLWAMDPQTKIRTGLTDENFESWRRMKQAALDAANNLDSAFVNQIESISTAEQKPRIEHLRMARLRQVCNRGNVGGEIGFDGLNGDRSGAIDLIWLVRRQIPPVSINPRVDAILNDYEQAATALWRAKDCPTAIVEEAQLRWQILYERVKAEKGNEAAWKAKEESKQQVQPISEQILQKTLALSELNRKTLDDLTSVLPVEQGIVLRKTFEKRAYPRISNDNAAIHAKIDAVVNLEDLTDAQRTALENLLAEYRPAYDEATEKMIRAIEPSDSPMNKSGRHSVEETEQFKVRANERARLGFERYELNVRTLHRLRAALTAAQIERLGGLPDPPERDKMSEY